MQSDAPNLSDLFEWITKQIETYGYCNSFSTGAWEVLISGKGLPEHEATGENIMISSSLMFHLDDKVNLEAEGNARPPIIFKYHRRCKQDISKETNE